MTINLFYSIFYTLNISLIFYKHLLWSWGYILNCFCLFCFLFTLMESATNRIYAFHDQIFKNVTNKESGKGNISSWVISLSFQTLLTAAWVCLPVCVLVDWLLCQVEQLAVCSVSETPKSWCSRLLTNAVHKIASETMSPVTHVCPCDFNV